MIESETAKFLLIRGLFLLFLIAFYRAAFCRVLASVCEAKLCLCVKFTYDFAILTFLPRIRVRSTTFKVRATTYDRAMDYPFKLKIEVNFNILVALLPEAISQENLSP